MRRNDTRVRRTALAIVCVLTAFFIFLLGFKAGKIYTYKQAYADGVTSVNCPVCEYEIATPETIEMLNKSLQE